MGLTKVSSTEPTSGMAPQFPVVVQGDMVETTLGLLGTAFQHGIGSFKLHK
jgi:hypothetical protein